MKLNFYMPTRIIMGNRCVENNADVFANLGKKAVIITGKHSAAACGALDDVLNALNKSNVQYCIYDRAMPNPTVEDAYEGADFVKEQGADFLIAIGGGSPMDAAKAISLLAAQDVSRNNLFSGKYKNKVLPKIFIPTTAGTGSEVTQYSILTDNNVETKKSLSSRLLFPEYAMLDSRYLSAVPHATAVNTAVDALSHCIESFLSKKSDELCALPALEGCRRISDCFKNLILGELSESDNENLQYGALLGGICIAQTGTTAVHAMGYSLTYYRHIDHGRANALLLADYLEFLGNTCREKVSVVLRAINVSSIRELKIIINTLMGKREEFTVEELEKYSQIAVQASNIQNCIVPPAYSDLFRIYKSALL